MFSQNRVSIWEGTDQVIATSVCGENREKEVNSPYSGLQALDFSHLIFKKAACMIA